MKLKKRVRIFQGALLDILTEAGNKADGTSEWAGIAAMTLLAQAINRAEDNGAFDEDEDDLPQVRQEAPLEER